MTLFQQIWKNQTAPIVTVGQDIGEINVNLIYAMNYLTHACMEIAHTRQTILIEWNAFVIQTGQDWH